MWAFEGQVRRADDALLECGKTDKQGDTWRTKSRLRETSSCRTLCQSHGGAWRNLERETSPKGHAVCSGFP